jgi:thymidylate synthase
MQQTLTYSVSNGYPVIPDRDISRFWRKSIGELCAFINGATRVEQFEEFGCDWWGPWATREKTEKRGLPEGDLGPGSYGGAFKRFPTAEGGSFDQFASLVTQLREFPSVRTHFVSPWIPQYLTRAGDVPPRATIAPCHGWVHVRILNGGLHLHMFQRSGDVPVGVPANMVQYAALLLMLSSLTGYEPSAYYHTISDAHIYEDQVDAAAELAGREPLPLGDLQLTPAGRKIEDVHDFRAEHFDLMNYQPHPAIPRIPVAV